MKTGNRINRNKAYFFRASSEEAELIETKIKESGIVDRGAFFRKAALGSCILRVNLKEIQDLTKTFSYYNNNVNQIAHHINATGAIYKNDLEYIKESQEKITEQLNEVIRLLRMLLKEK